MRLNKAWNINIVPIALSDFEGEAIMAGSGDSGSQIVCQPTNKTFPVPVTTLDRFIRLHGIRPSLVKIDVEGHEDAVLKGGEDTLSSPGTDVIIEFHKRKLANRGADPDSTYRSIFDLKKAVFSLETADSFGHPLSADARPHGSFFHLLLTSHSSLSPESNRVI